MENTISWWFLTGITLILGIAVIVSAIVISIKNQSISWPAAAFLVPGILLLGLPYWDMITVKFKDIEIQAKRAAAESKKAPSRPVAGEAVWEPSPSRSCAPT